jgi:Ras-related protein Rab-8A
MSKPFIIRLLTLGDSGIGKSSLLTRYTENEFSETFVSTIGIDFRLKTIEIKGKSVKIQIWDTAGQERFRTITHNYYRGAHGIVLMYDVTQATSFDNITKWMEDIQTHIDATINIILIGNKCDLLDKKVVSTAQGLKLAKEYGLKFFETSAKTNLQVEEAFTSLITQVTTRVLPAPTSVTSIQLEGKTMSLVSPTSCCK